MVEIEKNYYELPLPDVVQGMATDATPQTNNPATPTSDSNIVSTGGGSVLAGGAFQSPNFVTGSSGWIIRTDGSVEFGSGKFRGDITGASGTFSGTLSAILGNIANWVISSLALYFDGATDAQSSGMAPADYPFYAGKKYASRATAPFKVEPSGKLTVTDIVATGTINAQAGYLSAGVYVDTVNGIICESGGLNVGVAGHIRGGQTDYATGTGFFLGYSGGAYKFSLGTAFQVDGNGNTKVASLARDDYHWFTIFESIDGYATSGTVAIGSGSVTITTAASASATASLQKVATLSSNFSWAKKRKIKMGVRFNNNTNQTDTFGTGDCQTAGREKFGFKLIEGALYGVCGSGSDFTTTLLVAAISITNTYELEAVFTPGVSVVFWVNGVNTATITTNLPSSDANLNAKWLLDLELLNNGSLARSIDITYYDFWQEK